jgi:hypothetical protein
LRAWGAFNRERPIGDLQPTALPRYCAGEDALWG